MKKELHPSETNSQKYLPKINEKDIHPSFPVGYMCLYTWENIHPFKKKLKKYASALIKIFT